MLASLRTASGRARWARASCAIAAVLALAGLITYVIVLLVAPASPAAGEYHVLRRGDDYIVFTQPVADSDDNVHGSWRAAPNEPVPERLLTIHGSEVARLLAGEEPHGRVLSTSDKQQQWGGFASPWDGWADITIIERANGRYVWPWESCPSCADPRPTLVWTRGDAWKGASLAEVETGDWSTGDGAASPIVFSGVVTEHNFDEWVPRLQDATSALLGVSVSLGLWWALERRLLRREQVPSPTAPGTDEMLRLVHDSQRYLHLLHRQYVLGGVVLAVAIGTLAVAGLPPLISAAQGHFVDPYDAYLLLGLALPFLATIGVVAWGVGYARLRRERDRWMRLSHGLDDTAARLLEP